MDSDLLAAMVFVLFVLSGVVVLVMAMRQRSQRMEMQHRETMAMIERGMTPGDSRPLGPAAWVQGAPAAASRSLSLGIVVVALGLGLMTLISIAFGEPGAGVGVGGAVVIVGAAFIVNSIVSRSASSSPPYQPASGVPTPPVDPPL